MKTVTYLKAGLVSRIATEPEPEVRLEEEEQGKDERKTDLFTKAFQKVRERLLRPHRA